MIFFRREFLPSFPGKGGHFAPPSPPQKEEDFFFFTARDNPTITPFETLSLVNVFFFILNPG